MIVRIGGENFGVESTRGYIFPDPFNYSYQIAIQLLEEKLIDISGAEEFLSPTENVTSSILLILAYNSTIGDYLESAWGDVDESLKGNTKLMVIVTEGDDSFIYE